MAGDIVVVLSSLRRWWSAFACFLPGRFENLILDHPAFSRFLVDVVVVLSSLRRYS